MLKLTLTLTLLLTFKLTIFITFTLELTLALTLAFKLTTLTLMHLPWTMFTLAIIQSPICQIPQIHKPFLLASSLHGKGQYLQKQPLFGQTHTKSLFGFKGPHLFTEDSESVKIIFSQCLICFFFTSPCIHEYTDVP